MIHKLEDAAKLRNGLPRAVPLQQGGKELLFMIQKLYDFFRGCEKITTSLISGKQPTPGKPVDKVIYN